MGVLTFTAASTAFIAKTRNNRVRLWAGGGTGGAGTGNPSGGGGGAGGQYVSSRRGLAPGTSYTVAVGQLVTAANPGVIGQDTTFNTTDVVAKGGDRGITSTVNSVSSNGGVASTTGGVGDSVVAGGSGGTGVSGASAGGGGEAGGENSSGTPTTGTTGGVTTAGSGATNGGDGGTGGTTGGTGGVGAAGTAPGGGGGGGRSGSTTDRLGGDGARGQAIVDWIPPASLMMLGVG